MGRILSRSGAVALCAALLAAPAVAQETAPAGNGPVTADTVVATVNGTAITVGHMIVMRARLPDEYQQLPPDMLFPGILDQLIQQTALAQTTEGALSKGSQLALENEERSFAAGEAVNRILETAVTEEAIQAFYNERYAGTEPETEYNASHILVETEEEAKAVKAEIDAGGDFAEIAKARSTGPSGPNAGELGWFTKGMMVQEFEDAVLAMQPAQVSEPVQTQFGWHVIRLNETRLKAAPALEEVRGEIEGEIRQQAIAKAVEDATAAAEVVRSETVIDPAVLNDFSLVAP